MTSVTLCLLSLIVLLSCPIKALLADDCDNVPVNLICMIPMIFGSVLKNGYFFSLPKHTARHLVRELLVRQ